MDIIYVNCDFCITSSLLNTHTHRYTQYNNLPHGQPLFVGWKINVPARANTHINTLASPPLLSSFVSHKHSFTHLSASPCFFVMFHSCFILMIHPCFILCFPYLSFSCFTHVPAMVQPCFILMFHPYFGYGSPMLHFHVSPMLHVQSHVSLIFHFHVSPMFQQWFTFHASFSCFTHVSF